MEDGYEVTIRGLIRKRAELAGRAETLADELKQALCDLDHLDCAIRLFDPVLQVQGITPRMPIAPYAASKGGTTRAILAMLRETPLTTAELTAGVIRERGLSVDDRRLSQTIQARVASALRKLRDRGDVASSHDGEGGVLRCRVA